MAEKEEKKSVDEKRFAIFSKDTIKLIADSVGITELTDQAAALLGEDASYRLREATQNSTQYMKHAKRKKLMTDDFNKALRKSDVQPVYGHRPIESDQAWNYQLTKDGTLLFVDEADISLVDVALDPSVPTYQGNVSIKAHWLAVEGVAKSQPTQSTTTVKPVDRKLSTESQKYFEHITSAILGSDEELMKVAYTDLRTNPQILQLLPYFINFISNGVKTVSHDLSQLTRLLHTLRALLNNKSLYMEPQPYLNLLVQSVLHCLIEPLTDSVNPRHDHWVLRDYAARLLAQILFLWGSPINHLMYNTVKTLKDILYDHTKPLCSHYGAVMGILMLGQKPVQEILIPHLPVYMPHLNTIIGDLSVASVTSKADAHKVYGAILHAVQFLLKSQIKDFEEEISKEKENALTMPEQEPYVSAIQGDNPLNTTVSMLYSDMYNYFGDSLTLQLPNLSDTVDFKRTIFKPAKRDELVSLADPEAAKTGEELLEEIMEQARVQEEIRKAQLEREKLETIRRAREKLEREERDKILREKEERKRQERKRLELERELVLKRKEEEERLRMLKEQQEHNAKRDDVLELNSSHSEEEELVPSISQEERPESSKHSPLQIDHSVKTSVSEPSQGIKLKITRGPNKNLHVKTVETMSPPQKSSPKPRHELSPLYKNSPKSSKSESSPLYKHSPKSYKSELSPHYKHSPMSYKSELSPHYKHSPKHSSKLSSKDTKESKHSKKKKQVVKSSAKVYDEFDFDSDPEDFKPLPFKKSTYYSSEGESSDGAGNRKPLTLKIKMKDSE